MDCAARKIVILRDTPLIRIHIYLSTNVLFLPNVVFSVAKKNDRSQVHVFGSVKWCFRLIGFYFLLFIIEEIKNVIFLFVVYL